MFLSSSWLLVIWITYDLAFAAMTAWTAVLFFKRRSPLTWWLLAGALALCLGGLLDSVLFRWMPVLHLGQASDPLAHRPIHDILSEAAGTGKLTGGLCFQAALWFLLRRDDQGARRIAELEAELQGHALQEEPMNPPAHE